MRRISIKNIGRSFVRAFKCEINFDWMKNFFDRANEFNFFSFIAALFFLECFELIFFKVQRILWNSKTSFGYELFLILEKEVIFVWSFFSFFCCPINFEVSLIFVLQFGVNFHFIIAFSSNIWGALRARCSFWKETSIPLFVVQLDFRSMWSALQSFFLKLVRLYERLSVSLVTLSIKFVLVSVFTVRI